MGNKLVIGVAILLIGSLVLLVGLAMPATQEVTSRTCIEDGYGSSYFGDKCTNVTSEVPNQKKTPTLALGFGMFVIGASVIITSDGKINI